MNTMYVITHKKFTPPHIDGYVPIEVGADLRDEKLGYLKDNSGDNISKKNKNYCELTGLYWIWKNDKSDYIGICHYRRYFSKWSLDPAVDYYYSMDKLVRYLNKYDVILPKKYFWLKHNVATGYYEAGQGKEKDLISVRNIIQEKYPEYLSSYNKVLKSHAASYCNMMVCSKSVFDNYCKWLFDILFELEKITDLSDYSLAEARIYGYLSEILINVWVIKNKARIKRLSVVVDKPATKRRKPLYAIEKVPIIGCLSKILLCMDINYITNSRE